MVPGSSGFATLIIFVFEYVSNTTIALPEVLVHIGLLAVLFHLDLLSGLADLGLQLV